MTSPRTTPARIERVSPLRRISQVVLVAGTALAVLTAFGPQWLTRVGVGLAVVTAIVACVYAWREIARGRRAHAAAQLSASQRHSAALTEERQQNGAVVDTLTYRIKAAQAEVATQRVTIAGLTTEVSSLRGDNAVLTHEIKMRDVRIASLRQTVRAREVELQVLLADEDDAVVHALPRRVLAENTAALENVPAAAELWTDGDHPTVVDLRTLESAMILPNYEEDRKLA